MSSDPGPFLPVHTAVVLLMAAVIALIAGGLTFLAGSTAAGAVLAVLTGGCVSVPALRGLVG
ncbi:hypothetical protein AB0B50_19495 [Streptomyces sp. NPDC041068]|uniref:hypothetical protein n=1 Tax=Streptomyces sp. NPDC041068 TaxID=3155130 RepID=UPI0034053E73